MRLSLCALRMYLRRPKVPKPPKPITHIGTNARVFVGGLQGTFVDCKIC